MNSEPSGTDEDIHGGENAIDIFILCKDARDSQQLAGQLTPRVTGLPFSLKARTWLRASVPENPTSSSATPPARNRTVTRSAAR